MRHIVRVRLDPLRAQALQAALAEPVPLSEGAPLPPFYHQLYFWTLKPPQALGHDSHPKTGGLIPDFGLKRQR